MTSPAAPSGVAAILPRGVTLDDPLVARAVARVGLDVSRLAEYCDRTGVVTLALFGSVLRDDFRPDSDVDFLVEYLPGHPTGDWAIVRVRQELEALVGRPVDLVERAGLVNPFRRYEILTTARPLFRRP